jgi:vacuolar-type H+-ATPase subunit H
MSDDSFLTHIQDTEQQAAEMIEKALQKKQTDLQAHRNELAKYRQQSLEKYQEKSREELHSARVSARQNYEMEVEKGASDAKVLESEKMSALGSVMAEATDILTQKI